MRKIHTYIGSVLLAITSFACSTPQEQAKDILVDIQPMLATPLQGELMEEFLMTPSTKLMKVIQSRLFHFTPADGVSCLITNEYTDTLGYLPSIGNGPGEFISSLPDFAGISLSKDTLYMYDTSIRTVKKYLLHFETDRVRSMFIDKTKLQEKSKPGQRILDWGINRLKRLDNGYYVGFCDIATQYTFTLFDSKLNEITKFGEYPIKNMFDEGKLHWTPCFDGPLEIQGNSIYHATRDFAYMARYDVNNEGEVKLVWKKFYAKTKCRSSNNGIIFKSDNIQGFTSIAIGKEHIFAAYSGVKSGELYRQRSGMALYPRTIVIFDLQGNPLKKFQLQGRFVPICLDEDEEYLYVQHDDPDTSLWRYKVSDMLRQI